MAPVYDNDLAELTQFVFDQSAQVSDNDGDNDNNSYGNSQGDDDNNSNTVDEKPDEGRTVRNASTSSESRPERVVRRRARKACVACHKRKVRCDLLSRGHTCTNCRLDSLTCIVRQRGKRTRRDPHAAAQDVAPKETITAEAQALTVPTANSHGLPQVTGDDEAEVEQVEAQACPSTLPPGQTLPMFAAPVAPNTQADVIYSYYDFIESESVSHLAPEDFKFLEFKGCFHLPTRPILDELVREYFLHVHPVFPLIDERDFWDSYLSYGSRGGSNKKKISLFVFRAMLFVSSSFASDDIVQRLGFQKPIEARNCLYQRAKLLYQFDTSSDPFALAQGTLILTYYCSEREPMANTSWLQLAIQYAEAACVADYAHDMSISEHQRLTRKRLWWCLVLRDRILPLGVRRCIQITHDHFDFSQSRLSEHDLEHEFDYSQVYDRATKSDLARVLAAQIDMAVCFTDVISLVYPASGYKALDRLDYNAMRSMGPRIEQCKQALDGGHAAFQNETVGRMRTRPHESVSLYLGLTQIYYQTARAALCQFESLMLQAEGDTTTEDKITKLGIAMHAAVATITETVKEFVQLKIARYLPVSMVAYLTLPIILNSLDVKTLSSTNTRTGAKRRHLRLLNAAMDLCRERYSGAVLAQGFIAKTIEDARSEQHGREADKQNSMSMAIARQPVEDWFEIFITKPAEYLRLSFRIDISLAKGFYPKNEELPQCITLQLRLLANKSIPRSLMPPMADKCGDLIPHEDILTVLGKESNNSHLDFFNFDEF